MKLSERLACSCQKSPLPGAGRGTSLQLTLNWTLACAGETNHWTRPAPGRRIMGRRIIGPRPAPGRRIIGPGLRRGDESWGDELSDPALRRGDEFPALVTH